MVHVGVLTPITGGFYYGDVVANVTQAVAAAGGHVTLVQTIDAGRSRQKLPPAPDVPHIGWDSFDGIVAIAQAASASSLRSAIASGTPVVTVGSEIDLDAAQVVADNRDVVRGAVGHLVEHGHRRIAFVGNLSQSDTNARYEGFRAGVAAHGLGGGATLVTTVDHVEAGGRLAADAVLATGVTAVVTGTDRIALGLAAALRERGVRIPDDLAVIGYDDVEEGWWHDPPLTTVHQAIGTLGTRAAELLLAELRGEPDHGMHVVGSTFVARETCGCPAGAGGSAELGIAGADELVAVVLRHLEEHAGPGDEPDALARLDAVLAATVARLYPSPPPPEAMLSFSETVVDRFSVLAADAAGRGDPTADLLRPAGARTMLALRDHERGVTLERTERLASSIVEQYDVGIEVLSTSSGDPEQLAWLTKASARVACLALWEGDPADGVLHVTGVFDPEGRLDEAPSGTLRIEDFPPRALVEQADAGLGDVLYVVPVRGVNGDHGFLCVLGACERGSRSDPATYAHWATTHNHWAAVLAVALKQKALLGHLGRSEERYSLAASAAKDGLWEWEAGLGHVYVSERCRELLGVADDAAVTLDTWVALAHPLDTDRVAAELGRAVDEPGVPVEVEYRVTGADGATRWVLTRCLAVASEGVVQRVVGSVSDIQTRKDLEDQLRQEALYDNVTGLPNRRLFVDRLDAALRHQDRAEAAGFAVLFFDLDGQWICGVPQRVYSKLGYGVNRDIAVENEVTALVDYGDGVTGTFVTCTYDIAGTDRFEILGDQGKIVVEDSKRAVVTRLRKPEAELSAGMDMADVMRLFTGEVDLDTLYTQETIELESPFGQQHADVLENFARNVLDGTPLVAPGADGIHGVRLANAIHLSSWLDQEVALDLDERQYLDLLNERIREEGLFPVREV
ncbi:substrate-binding domain-containing protein [Cellulomonas cellasea]|uniref:PAC domain-containing protein n=1 Tax=Cellulomonas cellasea TaxID=43670 RepID=A0A4Y3KYT5_9CELL|nr:substrate-binding domain-containing protein [Cellulomonas cellasea]GEA87988.1 hypothetical protein CCE01nite_19370 [Cellulomonas cellasea]